ncbi:MAG: hypothetical protein JSV24_10530 [Bacteroidales bacterium]|nr:MAG: hypothetical protein JSV24_10530 [Bacteroidales bacterium]
MANIKYIILCLLMVCSITQTRAFPAGDGEKFKSRMIPEPSIRQDTTQYYYVKTTSSTRFFSDLDNMSSVIQMIPENMEVQVFEPVGDYYSAYYDGAYGFLFISKVDPVNFDPQIFQATPEAPGQQSTEAGQAEDRYTTLINTYGQKNGELIHAHKVWKGMTKKMVLDSWGRPRKIDRYIGKTSVKEEWFYRTRVLFIKDGQLVDWK